MSGYELAILGSVSARERSALVRTIRRMVADFGLRIGSDVLIHDARSVGRRDKHAAFAAAFFGGSRREDVEAACRLVDESAVVIPTVRESGSFAAFPDFLMPLNGLRRRRDDRGLEDLAVALLEAAGLLRRQRRVFISYRRIESRAAAHQLHDLLASRGFEVFLDTHSIRPGDPFQDVMWHRLCDSDVVVMLDTRTYFESRWTSTEFSRTLAVGIHILRVVWPGHTPSRVMTDIADTIYLTRGQLAGRDGPITAAKASQIVQAVEAIRSRSIASRYMSMVSRLRGEILRIRGQVRGVGAHQAISLRLLDGRKIWAYPAIGIPTAETLHDVAEKAKRARQSEPVLVYDDVGIRDRWLAHLKWLGANIKTVRTIRVTHAGWELAGW